MTLPRRKPSHKARGVCAHCETPLLPKDYETKRDFSRRQFCGKSCANLSRRGTAHEMLLNNSYRDQETGCWEWIGPKDPKGYGRCSPYFKQTLAHRISHFEFKGPVPNNLLVCHKCNNPSCINPEHLYAGTAKDNSDDARRAGRLARQRGEDNPNVKLTWEKVRAIRRDARSQDAIAAEYGVSQSMISMIRRGASWREAS